MKWGIVASVAVLLFLGGLAAYIGLGKSDTERVRETARAFVSGMNADDKEAVLATLTAEAREKMRDQDASPSAPGDKASNTNYTIGTPTIDGERATVPVTFTDEKSITLKMRREANEWRVWAMRFPTAPGGPQVTMDFEHPEALVGEMFRAAGEGMGAALKGLGEGLGAFLKGVSDGANAAPAPK